MWSGPSRTGVVLALASLAISLSAVAETPTTRPAAYTFTISKATTYVTGPVLPDGTIDYVAAINAKYGKGVTLENNAAILLLNAWGPKAIDKKFRPAMFKALKIRPLPEEGPYYLSTYDYAERMHSDSEDWNAEDELREKLERQHAKAQRRPFRAREMPEYAAWLRGNAKALDLAVAAAKRDRFFVPVVSLKDPPQTGDGGLAFSVLLLHDAATALRARAMLRVREGNAKAALEDLMAVHRLARLASEQPALMGSLVARAVDNFACEGGQAIAASGLLTAKQRRHWLAALTQLRPMPSLSAVLEGEHLSVLGSVMVLARGGWEAYLSFFESAGMDLLVPKKDQLKGWKVPRVDLDFDLFLRIIQRDHSRWVQAMRKPDFLSRKRASKALHDQVPQAILDLRRKIPSPWAMRKKLKFLLETLQGADRKKRTETLAAFFLAEPDIQLIDALAVFERARVQLDLTRLAFGLRGFREDRKAYPRRLDELAPRYVARIPTDRFAGKPLQYRRKGKGYLLYSLGANGRDDGGIWKLPPRSPEIEDLFTKPVRQQKDDIAVKVEK